MSERPRAWLRCISGAGPAVVTPRPAVFSAGGQGPYPRGVSGGVGVMPRRSAQAAPSPELHPRHVTPSRSLHRLLPSPLASLLLPDCSGRLVPSLFLMGTLLEFSLL